MYVNTLEISSKLDSDLAKKIFFCFNDSPSKQMNNVFYFIIKDLFVLKIFTFLLKFMTSQPGSRTIRIYILPNVTK